MKKMLLYTVFSVFLIACGGIKKTQEAVNMGNYDNAINQSILNLVENKSKKGNQPYIILLEEAFQKNSERELQHIAFLEKEENPANFEAIFKGYSNLRNIQERIKPLLPLRMHEENREAVFTFRNYEEEILDAKDDLSEYLFDNAVDLMENASNKNDYRRAYDDFVYLNDINPGFEDTKQKMEAAYAQGVSYVKVGMLNDTDQIVPVKLEQELLNFNTYGLDQLWTKYHSNPLPNITYDYEMMVALQKINISPEQVNEKQIIKEKQVKDGFQYAVDNNGNIIKDSLGNKIKIDKFKTVKCDFYQFTQFKSVQVAGMVSFNNLATKQEINSYPLASEFIFEHVYAKYNGDKRALDNEFTALLNRAAIPFPSSEQMVYNAGEDLKSRIKNILIKQRYE